MSSEGEGLGTVFTFLLPIIVDGDEPIMSTDSTLTDRMNGNSNTNNTNLDLQGFHSYSSSDIESQCNSRKNLVFETTTSTTNNNNNKPNEAASDYIVLNDRSTKHTENTIMSGRSEFQFLPNKTYFFNSNTENLGNNDMLQSLPDEVEDETNFYEEKSSVQFELKTINILIVDDSLACRNMIRKCLMLNSDIRFNVCCDQASDGKYAVEMIHINMQDKMNITTTATDDDDNDGTNTNNNENESTFTNQINKRRTSLKMNCQAVYDLILMDYQMPNKDGPTAIREIRSYGYKGKIIGLTGNVLSDDTQTMKTAGADDVLTKPVSPDMLENILLSIYNESNFFK